MAKAMWHILPLILLASVVAYMDRVNVSLASLQMNDDLKFSATIYGLGGGMFFFGYALFEVPSSLMRVRFSAPQWMARIMITWGLLTAAMMFVRTPMQCYVLRFLPTLPASVPWLAEREKAWIHEELARDTAVIGAPVRHNLLATFANTKVLLLGNGADMGLLPSAPAVLSAGTGLDTATIGYLVNLGGILLIGFSSTPSLTIAGCLLFAATYFAGVGLVLMSWADVLPVRELAVGSTASTPYGRLAPLPRPMPGV